MSLAGSFKLSKLTITGYTHGDRTPGQKIKLVDPLKNPLEAQFNPETLSAQFKDAYQERKIAGKVVQTWTSSTDQELDVKLVFDGTNVSEFGVIQFASPPSVAERVKNFLALCRVTQSGTHEPAWLTLSWGKDTFVTGDAVDAVYKCRLKQCDIKYTLFDRDGAPLRAELDAKFVEAIPSEAVNKFEAKTSPDLTHRRVVRAGDTLPALCREIYGSQSHHLRVARVNDLDDPRNLTPGQQLIFPPFDRERR
jgi:LysM repeat protein